MLVIQVVQITSLRPTADLFCSLLRDALKVELQLGQMKAVKTFVQTCYSEILISNASAEADEKNGREPSTSKTEALPASDQNSPYLGGLGLKFKFPGDARK